MEYTLDQKALLNQAYIGHSSVPSPEAVLQRMGWRGAAPQRGSSEAGSTDQAPSSKGQSMEPAQDECCRHCKQHGHKCAHMAACVTSSLGEIAHLLRALVCCRLGLT